MKLFKTAEAAKFLGVTTKTIKNWRKSGKLTPVKTGDNGYCFYSADQLLDLKNKLGKVGKVETRETRETETRECQPTGETEKLTETRECQPTGETEKKLTETRECQPTGETEKLTETRECQPTGETEKLTITFNFPTLTKTRESGENDLEESTMQDEILAIKNASAAENSDAEVEMQANNRKNAEILQAISAANSTVKQRSVSTPTELTWESAEADYEVETGEKIIRPTDADLKIAQNNLVADGVSTDTTITIATKNSKILNIDGRQEVKTIFPDFPIDVEDLKHLVIPYGYTVDNSGIYIAANRNVDVTFTPVAITKILYEAISGLTQYQLHYRVNGEWKNLIVEGSITTDTKKISTLGNSGILVSNAKAFMIYLQKFIAANSATLPTAKVYRQTGWDKDLKRFRYPTALDESIVLKRGNIKFEEFSANGDIQVWLAAFEKFFGIQAQEDAKVDGVNQKEVDKKIANTAYARLLFGSFAAAPLQKKLKMPTFQLFLWGERGSGKTGTAMFGLSIYGNPDKLKKTFLATKKNILETATAFNDLPLLLDEFEAAKINSSVKEIQDWFYAFAESSHNMANMRNGQARQQESFTSSIIMTGEEEPIRFNSKSGLLKRVLLIHAPKKFLDDDFATELHKLCRENYGLLGRDWIDYIVENFDKPNDDISMELSQAGFEECMKPYKSKWKDLEPQNFRQVILSLWALHHFIIMLKEKYNFKADYAEFDFDIEQILGGLIKSSEIDATSRALEKLSSYIDGHEKYFIRETKESKNDIPAAVNECYGKIYRNGDVAIYTAAAHKIIEGELGFVSLKALATEWAENGSIELTRSNGEIVTTSTLKWIDGKMRRVYFFPELKDSAADSQDSAISHTQAKD